MKTPRQQYWFDRGQKDSARGEILSFKNAPDHWTDLELQEAIEFYEAGIDEDFLNGNVDL